MKKLIVIDDEAIVIRGIRALLDRMDLDITLADSALNGLEGLEKIRLVRPDLVMIDIRMPGIDGLSLIQTVRTEFPEIICIIISGYTDFAYTQKAIKLGVYDYIDKPLTLEKLKEVLEPACRKRSRPQEVSDEKVFAALAQGNADEFGENALAYLRVLRENSLNPTEFGKECYRFLCVVREMLLNLADEEVHPPHVSYTAFQQQESEAKVFELARELIDFTVGYLSESAQIVRHDVIRKVLNYIDEHYAEDIGLTFLADHVNLNPTYLSILFKEEVGTSYVKYMTEYRMKKAKKLILEGVKISEISGMVGYNSYRYFGEIFKKQFGMSPNEYRNSKMGKS